MKQRLAIVSGIRTPLCKAGGVLKASTADDLGVAAVRELMARSPVRRDEVDELIFGNVAQPADAANIARVIALKAGFREQMPAYTVHRNCASGMESITTAALKILAGDIDVAVVGGTESMSNIPLLYNQRALSWFAKIARAKTVGAKLSTMCKLRPSMMLTPVIGIQVGLTDPVCGLNMGETAEVIARDFGISREQQDAYALESHQKACTAQEQGFFNDEIVPVPVPPKFDAMQQADDGPRAQQSMQALGKLRPVFDRHAGSVTAGNACPLTDGAVALMLMTEENAKARGLEPLGYLVEYAYAGLDGRRMGLGPVHATAKLLTKTGRAWSDFERIEVNEAFAAQVLGCRAATESADYARKHLDRTDALGEWDPNRVNVNGGAIALGHPVGATGARLVLTLLRELRHSNTNCGLATLCIGGGQGAALHLEVA